MYGEEVLMRSYLEKAIDGALGLCKPLMMNKMRESCN